MPLSFILIAVFFAFLLAGMGWLEKSGQERKEQGKRNWLRPIIVVVVGAMVLMVLWAVLTGN